jgi:membrane-associated protein
MEYRRFVAYNVFGGFGWVGSLTLAGYALGNVAWVRKNIDLVVVAIMILSITPGIVELLRHRRGGSKPPPPAPGSGEGAEGSGPAVVAGGVAASADAQRRGKP